MVCLDIPVSIRFGKPVYIYSFGDMQFGAVGFCKEAWQEFQHESQQTENAYFVGVGDYGNFLRQSISMKIKESMQKDPAASLEFDDVVAPHYEKIGLMMEFMKGKILWLHDGHHNWKFQDGTTATQRLCRDLKTNYGEWMAYNTLHFKMKSRTSVNCIDILSMHGTGNAQMASTDARWLESRMWPGWDADIYVRGHSTKLSALEVSKNYRKHRGTGFYSKSAHLLNCGGFCNGYTNGNGTSYVEMAGFLPSPLGWCVAKLEIKQLSHRRRVKEPLAAHNPQIQITSWARSYQEGQEDRA